MKWLKRWLNKPVIVRGILGCQNSPEYVRVVSCPIGTIVYSHYPVEGLFRCVGYCNEEVDSVDIIGELVLATQFGYPDDSMRGFFLEAILNGKRRPFRAETGEWRI